MGIAVFADKFSGTLSSNEVINEVNKIFKYNNIKASFSLLRMGAKVQLKYLNNMVLKQMKILCCKILLVSGSLSKL